VRKKARTTIQYNTIQYKTKQYNTIRYNTRTDNHGARSETEQRFAAQAIGKEESQYGASNVDAGDQHTAEERVVDTGEGKYGGGVENHGILLSFVTLIYRILINRE
jgi:hypothetical protein